MSEWGWVAAAFVVAYGSMGGYLVALRIRAARAARRLQALHHGGHAQ